MAGTRRKGKDPLPPPRAAAAPMATPIATLERPAPVITAAARPVGRRVPTIDRRIAAAVIALAVVLAAAGLLVLKNSGSGDGAGSAPRQAVLLTLDAADQTSLGGVLLVAGGQGTPGGVLVPPRLLVDVAGFGAVTFAESGRAPQSGAQAAALSDALGADVAGTWRLETAAVARLLDAAGGLAVDLESEVLGTDAAGNSVVLLPAGPQTLDGAAAVAYLQPRSAAEPEAAVAARLQQVVAGLLAALPADADELAAAVTTLGAGSRTDLPPSDLAATVAAVRNAETTLFQTIPLRPLDTGGDAPSYTLDSGAAGSLRTGLLAEVARTAPAGGEVRVLVRNGVGTPGLGEQARTRLVDAGLTYLNGGNAANFGYDASVVLISDAGSQARDRGATVATALGLPASAVQISGQGQNLADVVVILGADFGR